MVSAFDQQSIEPAMEEEQIQRKIAGADLYWELGTDEAEVAAKFQQELFHPAEQPTVQLFLAVFLRQPKELQSVRVPEDRLRLRVRLVHHRRHFCRGERHALEKHGVELTLEFPLRPPLLDRHPQVEFALLRPFALPEDDEIVTPGQLVRQWRTNWLIGSSR